MTNWFGNLGLAYKYTVVFLSLLVLSILAGLCKVWYNRRKLARLTKDIQDQEAGRRDDVVELNQREKDEGDLFGIRAIEAGFYAGVAQSRPTSRAGSYADSPSMSTSTLVGGVMSPKVQTHSMASSVTTLPLAHTKERDSATLPSDFTGRRKTPPLIKLQPSDAELNGRRNHNAAVDMDLTVAPSPVRARGTKSPFFGGSDSGDSEGFTSPQDRSPGHYAPTPPQGPVSEGLRVAVHSPEPVTKSLAASVDDTSPYNSTPPSPRQAPATRLPSMPRTAMRNGPKSTPEDERPASPVRLLPTTYQPSQFHQRDASDASSVYSNQNRMSTHHHKTSSSTDTYNYSLPAHSSRNSVSLSASKDVGQRQSVVGSSLLASGATKDSTQESQPREFYDLYRQSLLVPLSNTERPTHINLPQSAIEETPSPLQSPSPGAPLLRPRQAV